MAVSVRKPVLYAFGVVLCAGIIGGIWLWYRTHCVLITNDSRIEGTLVGVASRLSDRVVQVMVNEGDTVHKGDTLCIIEAMKLMNEITAEEDGEIIDICAANGSVVEYGQILFKLL